MKDTEDNPWIKVSDRLPEEADAYRGEVLWYGCLDIKTAMVVAPLNEPQGSTHWKRMIPPPQPTAEEMESMGFEAWAKGTLPLNRTAEGYSDFRTEACWNAWQARAKKGALGE